MDEKQHTILQYFRSLSEEQRAELLSSLGSELHGQQTAEHCPFELLDEPEEAMPVNAAPAGTGTENSGDHEGAVANKGVAAAKTHKIHMADTKGSVTWWFTWSGKVADANMTFEKWGLQPDYIRIFRGAFAFYSGKNYTGRRRVVKAPHRGKWSHRIRSWKAIPDPA